MCLVTGLGRKLAKLTLARGGRAIVTAQDAGEVADAVGIFPNGASIVRLVGAVLLELNGE